MNLLNRLWRRETKSRSKPHRAKKPSGFHPRLEFLEDRFLPSTGPSSAWVLAVGDTSPPATSISYGVATDAAGNVYTTGSFTGDFLPAGSTTKLYSAGGYDIFVAKYSSTGVYQWAVSMGGAGYDEGSALAVDSLGHVDVVGAFSGTASFGSTTLIGTGSPFNPFVAQLDANTGSVLWALNPFPTTRGHYASAVAVDNTGNTYVAGNNGSATSFFAAKVDPYGNLVWQDQITPNMGTNWASDNSIGSVAVSGTNVFFSGSFGVSATFATYPTGSQICTVTNAGVQTGLAAYVVELTSADQFVGATVFQPLAAGYKFQMVQSGSLAADSNGNVYASGEFSGVVNFAGSTSTTGPFVLNGGGNDGFGSAYIVKLSPTLSGLWAEKVGTGTNLANRASFGSVTTDGAGNVYLTGRYQGTVSFFGTYFTSNRGSDDVFAMKLNTNGALRWVVSSGGSESEFGEGIAVDSSGDVYVTGTINWEDSTNYTAKFDPTHSLKTSTAVAFLWKLTQP